LKILLAIDGSSCSDAAVEEVAARWWPPGSQARIISVVEHHGSLTSSVLPHQHEFEKEERRRATDVLARAAERVQASAASNGNLKVTTDVLQGTAKRVIVEEADSWGADLIVVGSHGYRSWERMLLGSVSQAVAMHAECSVEIVRRPRRKGD
jgi:nucleotide-binding universal stress UspA family protein